MQTIPILDSKAYLDCLLSKRAEYTKANAKILAFYDHDLGVIGYNPAFMLIPLDDHLVHRGDAVFETIMAANDLLYQLDEHLDRLKFCAEQIKLRLPCTWENLKNIILNVTRAAASVCKVKNIKPYFLLRILVGRGPGSFGIYPDDCPKASLYVVAYEFSPNREEFYAKGVTAFRSCIPAKPPILAGIKSTNYLLNVLMTIEAKSRGLDVAVAFDNKGYMAEAALANLCLLRQNNTLLIPEFDHSLAGTTILRVLELLVSDSDQTVIKKIRLVPKANAVTNVITSASGEKQILSVKPEFKEYLTKIMFKKIREEDLFKAKEILMLGTSIHCVAVVEYEQQKINTAKPGKLAFKLYDLLKHDSLTNGVYY